MRNEDTDFVIRQKESFHMAIEGYLDDIHWDLRNVDIDKLYGYWLRTFVHTAPQYELNILSDITIIDEIKYALYTELTTLYNSPAPLKQIIEAKRAIKKLNQNMLDELHVNLRNVETKGIASLVLELHSNGRLYNKTSYVNVYHA